MWGLKGSTWTPGQLTSWYSVNTAADKRVVYCVRARRSCRKACLLHRLAQECQGSQVWWCTCVDMTMWCLSWTWMLSCRVHAAVCCCAVNRYWLMCCACLLS